MPTRDSGRLVDHHLTRSHDNPITGARQRNPGAYYHRIEEWAEDFRFSFPRPTGVSKEATGTQISEPEHRVQLSVTPATNPVMLPIISKYDVGASVFQHSTNCVVLFLPGLMNDRHVKPMLRIGGVLHWTECIDQRLTSDFSAAPTEWMPGHTIIAICRSLNTTFRWDLFGGVSMIRVSSRKKNVGMKKWTTMLFWTRRRSDGYNKLERQSTPLSKVSCKWNFKFRPIFAGKS
jgi:hypothetical protein